METIVHGIPNILVYIDDLLLHSNTHEHHIQLLDRLLKRLIRHGIKLNLDKCKLGCNEVAYLGFNLTERGVTPGKDKLAVVKNAKPPTTIRAVRQFLGLCNFFRSHIKNFSQIAAPLSALTSKHSNWKKGDLPEKALNAFLELKSILTSSPVVAYPRNDRTYALITDAALGDDKNVGGLGAILTQIADGKHYIIAYASTTLKNHERNYTPFLLEMQAAIWGMEHFETYLKGRHFLLYTDHKPLEKLGKVHTRTLNRLQLAMNQFDFKIIYKRGDEMPADFLSRNITSIEASTTSLAKEQDKDKLTLAIKNYLLHQTLPNDETCKNLVKFYADDCFMDSNVLWK
jgi:ribonuclease HI